MEAPIIEGTCQLFNYKHVPEPQEYVEQQRLGFFLMFRVNRSYRDSGK